MTPIVMNAIAKSRRTTFAKRLYAVACVTAFAIVFNDNGPRATRSMHAT
ncbi:MAG: hypothetical protein ACREVO_20950 [Steroidobacteraceae bacterium]